MTCEERQDQILSYATGTLSGSELDELRAHLRTGCRSCAEYLSEVGGVLDALPLGIDPVTPPAGIRKELLKRAEASIRNRPAAAPAPVVSRSPGWWSYWPAALAGGAVAAAIVAGLFWSAFRAQRQTVASLQQDLRHLQDQVRQLRGTLDQTNQSIHLLQSPAVQLVSLEGTPARPQAKARVFWDKEKDAWHVVASGLAPTAPGKTYELWLINADQKKIPAGTFDVGPDGEGQSLAKPPPDAGRIVALAVTDEPAGGVPQPTGRIQLLGHVQ